MKKIDRIIKLHRYLSSRRTPATMRQIQDKLECSRPTAVRVITDMRDRFSMPLEYIHGRGYILTKTEESHELPGLWFNDSELYALLTTHHLLKEIQPGLLEDQIAPLRNRLNKLLQQKQLGGGEIEKRVRILQMAARSVDLKKFRTIATAVMERRRLRIWYHGRGRDKITEREVSPQRLVYYRDNWYLDAWCHMRQGIRSFSVDRAEPRDILDQRADDVDEQILQQHLADSYGIFAGEAKRTALLRFNSQASKWVGDEQWHPKQQTTFLKDGSLEMKIPYNDPTELMMDILKHGPDVEVIQPAALRSAVAKRLCEAAQRYKN